MAQNQVNYEEIYHQTLSVIPRKDLNMISRKRNYTELYHQILSVIPIILAELAMGFISGWVAPTIKKLLENSADGMTATRAQCSWMASLFEIGIMLGSVVSLVFMDILGRAFLLRTGAAIMFITWFVIMITRSLEILIASRLSVGIGVAISWSLLSLYLGENCNPHIRGIASCVSIATYYFGRLVSYILGKYLSYRDTVIVNVVVTLICLLSSYLLVETPQFLIMREKHEKAEENLMWLRGAKEKTDVSVECKDIRSNIAMEKLKRSSYWKLISNKTNLKSIMIVLVIAICQPATGMSAIANYISIMFPSTTTLSSHEFTIVFGIAQLVSAVLCSLVVERFKRRTLALLSTSVFVICHLSISFICLVNKTSVTINNNPMLVFVLITVNLAFEVIINSLFYMLRGEMFPQSIKPLGSGFCIIIQAMVDFVIEKIFLMVAETYGMFLNFLIYAVITGLTFVFCYFALPETRGKTLLQIQKELES